MSCTSEKRSSSLRRGLRQMLAIWAMRLAANCSLRVSGCDSKCLTLPRGVARMAYW